VVSYKFETRFKFKSVVSDLKGGTNGFQGNYNNENERNNAERN